MPACEIEYPGARGELVRAVFASPEEREGRPPGLILVGSADPRTDAALLAGEGFTVLAPEPSPDGPEDDRTALARLEAGVAYLATSEPGCGDCGVLGIGAGSARAFLLACTSRSVSAIVVLGGPLVYDELSSARPTQPLELALNLSAPFLGQFAEGEAELARTVERTLAQFAKRCEVHVHAGTTGVTSIGGVASADRGFLNPAGGGYHETRASRAWKRTLEFLREELGGE